MSERERDAPGLRVTREIQEAVDVLADLWKPPHNVGIHQISTRSTLNLHHVVHQVCLSKTGTNLRKAEHQNQKPATNM